MQYGEVYMRLLYETAIVVFEKKDRKIRVMLCTRNLKTAALEFGNLGGLLAGHDKRCSIHNGNLAVVDMVIGECRAFGIERVINITWLGVLETDEAFNEKYSKFKEVKTAYESGIASGVKNVIAMGLDYLDD